MTLEVRGAIVGPDRQNLSCDAHQISFAPAGGPLPGRSSSERSARYDGKSRAWGDRSEDDMWLYQQEADRLTKECSDALSVGLEKKYATLTEILAGDDSACVGYQYA